MNRTSILISSDVLLGLKSLAQKEGVSLSQEIRKILENYLDRQAPARGQYSFVGLGSSGGKMHLAEKAEDLLFQEEQKRSKRTKHKRGHSS